MSGSEEQQTQTQQPGSEEHSSSDAEPKQPLTESQKADAVAELLNGTQKSPKEPLTAADQGEGTPKEPEAAQEPQKAQKKPTSVGELAEALGVEPKVMYDLDVSIGDDETVKLGELKDAYKTRQKGLQEIATKEAQIIEREGATIQAQMLWSELGAHAVQGLNDTQMKQLQDHMKAKDTHEREKMAQIMPELADPQQMTQFRTDTAELLGKYGYAPQEMVIADHRQMWILKDYMALKKRMKALEEFQPDPIVPSASHTKGRRNQNASKAQMLAKAKTGSEADKIRAIGQLMKG